MLKITLEVEGMQCGMCEAHVNDTVRKAFPVKKVTSSHTKKSDGYPVRAGYRRAGAEKTPSIRQGYEVLSCKKGALPEKGLFLFFTKIEK